METLSNLESFVRSAESSSFSAAARRLALTPAAVSRNVAQLERNDTHWYSLRMLVHDWSRDPVMLANPGLAEDVIAAQIAGLRELHRGRAPLGITQRFIERSGLFEAFARSIGLEP